MRTEVPPFVVAIVLVAVLILVAIGYWQATKPKEIVKPRVTAPTIPTYTE
jgi:cytochrome oxidase assembly protein ShyY1